MTQQHPTPGLTGGAIRGFLVALALMLVAGACAWAMGSPLLAMAPVVEKKPGGGGTSSSGAKTLWVNYNGDTTKSWFGMSPGTTPPDAHSLADQAMMIDYMRSKIDGINDVEGVAVTAGLNVQIVTDYGGGLTLGQSYELVVGGQGLWAGPAGTIGGISGTGGFSSSSTRSLTGGKSFLFSYWFGTGPRDEAWGGFHEGLGHPAGLPHTDGYYKPGFIMGLPYGYLEPLWTASEWATLVSVYGTASTVPEPAQAGAMVAAVMIWVGSRWRRA